MKRLKIMAVAVLAVAFGRPAGYCTANSQADDIAQLKEQHTALQEQFAEQQEELARLRTAQALPAEPLIATSTLQLLVAGAGVKMEDVAWRIRAGLSEAQAVEVALNEKREREAAESKKKEAKK